MKYLFLLLLTACSTADKRPLSKYECSAIGRHGSFAKWIGEYQYLEQAQEDGEKIRSKLVEQDLIPSNTVTVCYKMYEKAD